MKILFLTQWFDPEPTPRGLTFARELRRLGHEVQVLTGFPNYPGGKLYPGYRIRLLQRELIDGIDILRVPLYPSHSRSSVGRIVNYLSFAAAAALIGPVVVAPPDVIYAYHPPATVGLPALVLRVVFGARLVYDIQDLWPDTVAATGMLRARWMMRLLSAWCGLIYRQADHLTVLSPGFKLALTTRGVPAEKISVIYNWCDETHVRDERAGPAARDAASEAANRFTIVFAGNMGAAQALDSVLEAARLVKEPLPHVHFLFIGGGIDSERLKRRAATLDLTNVSFLPPVPVHEIGRILLRADALLVHLRDDPLFQITIPSKTQAYMAAGRPILMAVKGDAEDLVREADCGISCPPENPRELASAIHSLATESPERRDAMGVNGRAFYESRLSLGQGVLAFEAIYKSLAGQGLGLAGAVRHP